MIVKKKAQKDAALRPQSNAPVESRYEPEEDVDELDQLEEDLLAELLIEDSSGDDGDLSGEDEEHDDLDALSRLESVLSASGYIRAERLPPEPTFPSKTVINSKGTLELSLRDWEEFLYHLDGELIWYEAAESILAAEHKELESKLKKAAANNTSLRNDMQRRGFVEGNAQLQESLRVLSEYQRYRRAQEKRKERARNVSKMLQRLLYYNEDEAGSGRATRFGGGPGSARPLREKLKNRRRGG